MISRYETNGPWDFDTLAGTDGAAPPASMLEAMQPPETQRRPLRWGRASSAWHNAPGNGSWVDCWPASDAAATVCDTARSFRVWLPRCPGRDPNVAANQVIAYGECEDGALVAVSGYLDDAIGTIKMWAPDGGYPPAGWTECIPGGIGGRPSPSVTLNGRFPIGRDTADAAIATVGAVGGNPQRTHSHALVKDLSGADLNYSQTIDEGNYVARLLTILEAEHFAPFGVVRFIERYDNSTP